MTRGPGSIAELIRAQPSLRVVWSALPEARLVGGVVRDLLADRPIADLDFAIPEPPERVLQRLRDREIRAVPTGLSHGTVTAIVGGTPHEITTLRRDVETDGRHAVVAWTDDWRQDAARRDFTINAMSLDRNGTLHDYFDGAADLTAGRVRFVGRAATRIAEDALRILRFFRFHARYGTGPADPDALTAIGASLSLLHHLSAERVWSELCRLLQGDAPAPGLSLMRELGVLDAVLPGGGEPDRVARLPPDAPADPLLRLAALASGDPEPVAARLRLSNAETGRLVAARRGPVLTPTLDDDALRRLLATEPPDRLLDRSWLGQLTDRGDPQAWRLLRHRIATTPRPVFPLSGRDAVSAGLSPGPAVGDALRRIRAWWQAGGCRADRAACLARLNAAAQTGWTSQDQGLTR